MSGQRPHEPTVGFAQRGQPWYDAQGRKRCGVKASHGGPCLAMPVKGKHRCKNHGGRTPSGLDSPHYRHGQYSQDMPAELLGAYQRAVGDPELLELRSDAAILHAFMVEALKRMDGSFDGSLWAAARTAYRAFQEGLRTGDRELMSEALDDLEATIDAGQSAAAGRKEVRELLQERRRVVESERGRLKDMHQMVTAERVAVLFGALLDIAGRYITAPGDREAFKGEALGLLRTGEAAA